MNILSPSFLLSSECSLRLYGRGVSGFSLVGHMIKNAFMWAILIFVDNIVEV